MNTNLNFDFSANLTDDEYIKISNFVYTNIGINLGNDKKALVSGRLQKLLKKYNFQSYNDYFNFLKHDKTGEALSELADNISTNHTFFYRESSHFDYFKDIALPNIIKKKQLELNKDIRIWCAGCSSGEEAYMIVMLMLEVLGLDYKNYTAGLLATDISSRALKIAINGEYNVDRLGKLPKNYINKYFNKVDNDFYVIDSIKKEITYRRFNLIKESFDFKKKFDIIFCRNVMIYFDAPTRIKLIENFYKSLNNEGYLFIGHSETIERNSSNFNFILPAIYQK
jgi:chemotaxis protein methyltransferase CheR